MRFAQLQPLRCRGRVNAQLQVCMKHVHMYSMYVQMYIESRDVLLQVRTGKWGSRADLLTSLDFTQLSHPPPSQSNALSGDRVHWGKTRTIL